MPRRLSAAERVDVADQADDRAGHAAADERLAAGRLDAGDDARDVLAVASGAMTTTMISLLCRPVDNKSPGP